MHGRRLVWDWQQYGASVFGNGTVPGGVLEHPGQLGDEAYKHLQTRGKSGTRVWTTRSDWPSSRKE